jgi:hypothetical protein
VNASEEYKRCKIFTRNLYDIERHNRRFMEGKKSFKKGINWFADLCAEEFKKGYTGMPNVVETLTILNSTHEQHHRAKRSLDVPRDWRAGIVDLRTAAVPM